MAALRLDRVWVLVIEAGRFVHEQGVVAGGNLADLVAVEQIETERRRRPSDIDCPDILP
jgi:hypothetical protein